MLLRVVGSCCVKFETGKTFEPITPNICFAPLSPKRSAAMLDPFVQYCLGHALSLNVISKVLWVVSNIVGSCYISLHTTANMDAKLPLLCSWKILLNSAQSHWLLRSHMTSNMKLFPAKMSERATLQKIYDVRGYPRILTADSQLQRGLMNFQLQIFQLYNKSLKDWSLGKQWMLFPNNSPREHWDSRETKLTVPLVTSHYLFKGEWTTQEFRLWSDLSNFSFAESNS